MDAALGRFEEAAETVGRREFDLIAAAHRIRLVFAGDALVSRHVPALAHLVVAHAPALAADLTVYLWDDASTGVGMIASPWQPMVLGPGGSVPAAQAIGLDVHCRVDTGMVTMLDAAAGRAFLWIDDVHGLSRYEGAAPLRQVFAAFFARAGICMTHAAAVGRAGRGVLIGGRGGLGKSTTALLSLAAGLDYAGDDYVLVTPDRGVCGLYATAKVMDPSVPHLAALRGAFEHSPDPPRDGEKAIAYLNEHRPGQLARRFALAAVAVPRLAERAETRALPLRPAQALRRLAPSTVFQHGGHGQVLLAMLARITARVPCYELELGRDFARIPRLVAALSEGTAT